MLNFRGQIFGTDAIVAVIIFTIILTLFVLYSNQLTLRIDDLKKKADNFELAQQSLLRITETRGIPANWEDLNQSQIQSIGLMETFGIMDANKLSRLVSLDVNSTALKTQMGLPQFNFELTIQDLNGVQQHEFGTSPSSDIDVSKSVVPMVLNGEKVFVQLEVFE